MKSKNQELEKNYDGINLIYTQQQQQQQQEQCKYTAWQQ